MPETVTITKEEYERLCTQAEMCQYYQDRISTETFLKNKKSSIYRKYKWMSEFMKWFKRDSPYYYEAYVRDYNEYALLTGGDIIDESDII